jgi:hypothetical protein
VLFSQWMLSKISNLISIFFRLGRLSKESAQVQGFFLYGDELLVLLPTSKLEDLSLSTVHDCLFSIFVANLNIWRPSPPSATWGCAMLWWQESTLVLNFMAYTGVCFMTAVCCVNIEPILGIQLTTDVFVEQPDETYSGHWSKWFDKSYLVLFK